MPRLSWPAAWRLASDGGHRLQVAALVLAAAATPSRLLVLDADRMDELRAPGVPHRPVLVSRDWSLLRIRRGARRS